MVQSAEYIFKKIKKEKLLSLAFNKVRESEVDNFPLVTPTLSVLDHPNTDLQVCTGHSLGGGTAAILAILLREEYPDTTCYAFSPPGGLLRYLLLKDGSISHV